MKIVMIANVVIKVCFMICVTILAITFSKISLLWWFLLTPFLEYEYKRSNNTDHPTGKGGGDA